MKKNNRSNVSKLRTRAEEIVVEKHTRNTKEIKLNYDNLKLIHELEVHQIELEMQNDELLLAKEKAEIAERKYYGLYNFAPAGYLTLSKEGDIIELNFCAASMLGKKTIHLIGNKFTLFISEDTHRVFNSFFKNLFQSKIKVTCEVKLEITKRAPIYVQLNGIISENDKNCLITMIDIDLRKTAEDETRHLSNERQIILDNIGNGVFFLKNKKVVKANKEAAEMYGYSMNEIIGSDTSKFYLNKKSYEEFGRKAFLSMYKGLRFLGELNQITKSGEVLWCSFTGQALNAMNPDDGSIWVVENITERKRLEHTLLESEKLLLMAQKMGHTAYWTYNPKTDKINASTEGYRIYGLVPNSEGLSLKDIEDCIPERDRVHDALKSLTKDGTDYNLEFAISPADGSPQKILHSIAKLEKDAQGNITKIIGFIQDITKRKQTEKALFESEKKLKIENQRFETAMNSIDAGVYVSDLDTYEVLFVNQYFSNVYGDIVGKKCYAAFQKGQNSPCSFCTNHLLRDKDGNPTKPYIWEFQNTITHRWSHLSDQIIRWTNGKLVRLEIAVDITERKRAEEIIQQQNIRLAELSASKDKFFSIIAHDLKSPISGFLGLTEIMQSPDMSLENMREINSTMNNSASNLSKLLENLLTWARIKKGVIEFKPEYCILSTILNRDLSVLNQNAKQKDIEIINRISIDLKVFADISMLDTVFRNLISNAIKFTRRGGKIIISAEKKDNNILISIKDTGIGMNAKLLDGIFKIDQKTSRPGTEKESSTGLGLLLCKEFIEEHSGKIWAISEEDKGSTFYFTLCDA